MSTQTSATSMGTVTNPIKTHKRFAVNSCLSRVVVGSIFFLSFLKRNHVGHSFVCVSVGLAVLETFDERRDDFLSLFESEEVRIIMNVFQCRSPLLTCFLSSLLNCIKGAIMRIILRSRPKIMANMSWRGIKVSGPTM